jgi:hypothetical protein
VGVRVTRSQRRALWFLVLAMTASPPASAEWVLGAFLGASATHDGWLRVSQPTAATSVRFAHVPYHSESLEAPPYYGYRFGFVPHTGWVGIEAEFIHLKTVADTARLVPAEGRVRGTRVEGSIPVADVLDRFAMTHGMNLLLLNALVRTTGHHGMGEAPRWLLVARFGAGASLPHAESAADGLGVEQYEWGGLGVQAGAGGELRLAGPFYVSGEYKITRTVPDVRVAGGSARTRLLTHHVAVGLTAHLGR